MNRRELFKRSIGVVSLTVLGVLMVSSPAHALKKRPKNPGMECICTDIQVAGDGKGQDKTPNGSLIYVANVRRDNGKRVVAFIGKKTKIFRQGSRVKYLDLRDMLYATPEGIREGYVDVPVRITFTATQLAKKIEFDP
ncbi:MAG: hypothetical protein ACO1SX_10110 [Actinomycetota bacterium]